MSLVTSVNSNPNYPSLPINNPSNFSQLITTNHDKSTALDSTTLNSSGLVYQNNFPEQPPVYVYAPISFRQIQDPSISYQFPSNPGQQIILKEDLATLRNCLNSHDLPGFNPWPTPAESHPIHNELYQLCNTLLQRYEQLPLESRISFLNSAIADIVLGCVCSHSPDHLNHLAIMPKFELLEIALRSHLFQGLLSQENREMKKFYDFNHHFPDNLYQRETALHLFCTKDHFYHSPNLNLYSILAQELLKPTLSSCIDKTVIADPTLDSALRKQDEHIASQLKTLHLSQPSQCSLTFEALLRDDIARKVIAKLAAQYKKEFQETGNLSREQLCTDSAKLSNFITAKGKLTSLLNPMIPLIAETFELLNNLAPFVFVRAKIIQEQHAPLQPAPKKNIPTKLLSWVPFPSRSSNKITAEQRQKEEKDALAIKQHATINWVEQEWDKLMQPIPISNAVPPSAPVIENSSSPLPETPIPENLSPEPLNDWLELNQNGITQRPLIYPSISPSTPSVPPITHQLPIIDQVPLPTTPPISIESIPIASESPPQQFTPIVIIAPHSGPVPVETPKFKANDPNVPVISYVDIAFEELLNRGSDVEKWNGLPQIVQKDVLRHVYYYRSTKGKAEELTLRIFKNDGLAIQQEVNTLNKRHISAPFNGLPKSFISAGQELIDFYYSDKSVGQFHNFINRFRELPKEPRFYQYVYEMAKAANVHIESWDQQFAQYNWDQPGILHLSVQALERCLHTAP